MPMDIYAPPGTLLVFKAEHGGEYAKDQARRTLTVGAVYTLKSAKVYGFRTDVEVEEAPGTYNSVLFEEVPGDTLREADKLLGMLQATMGLEGQGITDRKALEGLRRRMVRDLLG